ncbi:hypothetical protein [Streptomyces sp. NPDC002994]|uniref:hypothetical protein n=1 Tax=Streptomyces sp. NPDC002994 TaxID=3154441 RepID=UPI0033B1068F
MTEPHTPATPGIGYEFRESLLVLLSRVQRGVQSEAEADLLRSHIEHLLSEHDRLAASAVHVGGNAEDCPACHGTNPPYPFICPGPEQQPTT